MTRSSEACHSWQTCVSKPRGVKACSQRPHQTPPFVSPIIPTLVEGYHLGKCGWHTQPATKWRRPSSAPARTMPGRTSKGHQSPLGRQYFPPILSYLSCLPPTPKALLSHTSSSSSPHKDAEPRGGVLFSFLPTILPWVAKGFPHDSRNAQLPGETSASQWGPGLWRVGEEGTDSQCVNQKFK